jgi:hypothetical protein
VNAREGGLLPSGHEIPFSQIEATLARLVRDGRRRNRPPARALTATVIAIGTQARLAPAADALEQLAEAGGVRAILISEGEHTAPTARVTENSIAIAGLAPRFLNNAVAALRLSSLPAAVWWRGGSVEALDGLAGLADRLVLDTEDPTDVWARASRLFDKTALTDLRWARLTRWRAVLAHLFDLPQVLAAAPSLRQLSIEAADPHAARLFAGWLSASLGWRSPGSIELTGAPASSPAPLRSVRLGGPDLHITLAVKPSGTCLEAAVEGDAGSSRAVPLGDGGLTALIGEELGVRTRDLAFERALVRAQEIRA